MFRAGHRLWLVRQNSTTNFFKVFPKTFPQGGPPKDAFKVNLRLLRLEYRGLQREHHPDIVMGSLALTDTAKGPDVSSDINRAYSTLKNPFARAAYVVQLLHPENLDITQDDVSKQQILRLQAASQEHSLNYKTLLMTVLEAHESLESAQAAVDLEAVKKENDARIAEAEQTLDKLLGQTPVPWDDFLIETIKLKYWVNIANGIKEWEPGKPVLLTH